MGGVDPAVTAIVRDARCKDCVRERQFGWNDPDAPVLEADEHFEYNEAWAQQSLDRGGSRTDRCPRHRRLHKQEISGLAVAYIDLRTVGEVADRRNPMGPLGQLGPLPDIHVPRQKAAATPFSKFGMTDDQVREIYELMSDPKKRVLVLKAGTGTGKSTFFPFRLLCPPDGVDFSFTARGPIVVTEPRVQATVGVSRYVGERLVMGCPLMECSVHGSFNPKSHLDDPGAPAGETCPDPEQCGREHVGDHPGEKTDQCRVADCARHIGPGYPVGYQVKGDARHDAATQLVYVTDGTMINWLREGRLNKIGTVVVDEAHERSTNIDFIMGYLRRELDRYPHLRVVITSATFDVDFYENYFGGPERVQTKTVPAQKTFGYGAPLFPITDGVIECGCERDKDGKLPHEITDDFETWRSIPGHWPESERYGPAPDDGSAPEDLWAITKQLNELRFAEPLQDDQWTVKVSAQTRTDLAERLAKHVVKLVNGLVERGIYGDVLAFLPNNKLITDAVAHIEQGIDLERADVYALIQSAPQEQKEAALESRPRDAKRKIVVSTNLAETSLTVSGVRFVVDCALTTQGEWDPTLASKSVPTSLHSQAGVRQRWGRVGRDAPGWVFPLYTRSQFDKLPRDTPAGSTRENLEQLIMKAKSAGIDDVANFPWPAAHEFGSPDQSAQDAMAVFKQELVRAGEALVTSGVVDADGHLTAFGKELERFGQHSAGFTVATIIADQLACVPEVVTALNLLEAQKPQGYEDVDLSKLKLYDRDWPKEWKDLADYRWQQLHVGCRDDLDVALRVVGLWERADLDCRPWEPSQARETWSRSWWLRHDLLFKLAELRRTDLEGLSAAMKEDVKRCIDPRLTPRARAAITRAFVAMWYRWGAGNTYSSLGQPGDPPADLSQNCRLESPPRDAIALTRGTNMMSGRPEVRNLVAVTSWAARPDIEAMDLVLLCAERCRPEDLRTEDYDAGLRPILDYPIGAHVELSCDPESLEVAQATVHAPFGAPAPRPEETDDDTNPSLDTETEAADDSAPSGGIGWPTGFNQPLEDEERNERLRLEEPDNDDRDEASGRPLGIETNDEDIDPNGHVVQVLASSEGEVPIDLRLGDDPVREPGWYRCREYQAGPSGLKVHLEPLSADRIQVTDPRENPSYALFKPGMLVRGVVDDLSKRGLRVRFRDQVTGFSTREQLPRPDYELGEAVIARVYDIDVNKKRLRLDLKAEARHAVKVTAPDHWHAALRYRVAELNASLPTKVWASGLDITLSSGDPEVAQAAAERLKTLLGSPAAVVDVPGDTRGRIQGTRSAHLIAARTESGALVCDFAHDGNRLVIAAETQEQLRRCLDACLAHARPFTGRLTVPPGRTSRLIGGGGATVKRLITESGCYRAEAGPDGHFKLAASTAEALAEFTRLANAEVPGCVLVEDHTELLVRDVFGDSEAVDWRSHTFARGDKTVSVSIDAPTVVDMSPPAEPQAALRPGMGATDDVASSDRALRTPIRLAKVAAHRALIIDVDPKDLAFQERDATTGGTWSGQLTILTDDSLKLTVGDYDLVAHRTGPNSFLGIETSTDGEHEFEVVHLAGDRSEDLTWRQGSSWLLVTTTPTGAQSAAPLGVARVAVGATGDWSIASGLFDSPAWRIKTEASVWEIHADPTRLRLTIERAEDQGGHSVEVVFERHIDDNWFEADGLALYPIVAGGDPIEALRQKTKRRRTRSRRRSSSPREQTADPFSPASDPLAPADDGSLDIGSVPSSVSTADQARADTATVSVQSGPARASTDSHYPRTPGTTRLNDSLVHAPAYLLPATIDASSASIALDSALRRSHADIRATRTTTLDVQSLPADQRSLAVAYLSGLAQAHPAGTLTNAGSEWLITASWPGDLERPPLPLFDTPRRAELHSWDDLADISRPIRLGYAIDIVLASVDDEVRGLCTYFLAGVAMALELRLEPTHERALRIRRP